MSVLTTLQTAKSNVCNLIALITANPKPTYSINGQSVQWESYYRTLTESLKTLNEQIQVAGGPFELQTQAAPISGSSGAGIRPWI
jgi:hypothetical protein